MVGHAGLIWSLYMSFASTTWSNYDAAQCGGSGNQAAATAVLKLNKKNSIKQLLLLFFVFVFRFFIYVYTKVVQIVLVDEETSCISNFFWKIIIIIKITCSQT